MIAVTERARQELKKILSVNVDDPEVGLRLTAAGAGHFGLSADAEISGDQVVEHEGSKVLLVEQELADQLEGITLDVEDTPEGPKLAMFKSSETDL